MLLPETNELVISSENDVNSLPVISFSSSTPTQQNNQSLHSNLQSSSSLGSSNSSLPPSSQLPLRFRNEPAVVGSATGEVRRMRSVLDMKLGGMALPLDVHLGLDTTFSAETQHHSQDNLSNDNLIPGKKRAPVSSIEIQGNVPDKKRLSRVHAAALAVTQQQQHEMVDEFGIAIPTSTQIKMAREAAALNHHFPKDDDRFLQTISSSSLSDGSCSVVLAESPSRLDLSALLC